MNLTPELKAKIDAKSHESLLGSWRKELVPMLRFIFTGRSPA